MAVWKRVAAGRDVGCSSSVCGRRNIRVGGDEDAEPQGEEFVSSVRGHD